MDTHQDDGNQLDLVATAWVQGQYVGSANSSRIMHLSKHYTSGVFSFLCNQNYFIRVLLIIS